MNYMLEVLPAAFVYGVLIIGCVNNLILMGLYAYGIVALARHLRGAK